MLQDINLSRARCSGCCARARGACFADARCSKLRPIIGLDARQHGSAARCIPPPPPGHSRSVSSRWRRSRFGCGSRRILRKIWATMTVPNRNRPITVVYSTFKKVHVIDCCLSSIDVRAFICPCKLIIKLTVGLAINAIGPITKTSIKRGIDVFPLGINQNAAPLQKSHVPPQFNEQALVASATTFGSNASKNVNTSSLMISTPKRSRLQPSVGTTTSRKHVTACGSAETFRAFSSQQPRMCSQNCFGQDKPAADGVSCSGKRGAQGSSSHRATINVVRLCPAEDATPQPGSTQ